jgi:hypothetical protein
MLVANISQNLLHNFIIIDQASSLKQLIYNNCHLHPQDCEVCASEEENENSFKHLPSTSFHSLQFWYMISHLNTNNEDKTCQLIA